jgi:hypothetical protein
MTTATTTTTTTTTTTNNGCFPQLIVELFGNEAYYAKKC